MSENVVSNIDIRVDDRDEEDFQVCYFRKRRRRCDATETTEIRDHNPRALNDDFVVDMFNCCVRRGNVGKPPHIFTLKNKLLQNVISSLVRLQLTASSELGKTVVAFLVNAQLELVKDQFSSALKEHQRQKHLLNIVMSSRNDVGERKPRFLIDIVDD